jgi:hypothetical protein
VAGENKMRITSDMLQTKVERINRQFAEFGKDNHIWLSFQYNVVFIYRGGGYQIAGGLTKQEAKECLDIMLITLEMMK